MLKIFLSLILTILVSATVQAKEVQIIAGAGPSTEIVTKFFYTFGQKPESAGAEFKVMPESVKHSGGLKNSDIFLFGRTGRPLTDEEKGVGKREIFLGRVSISYAVGLEAGIKSLSDDQIRLIYAKKVNNWKQVGGLDAPILLVGRSSNEAVLSELKKKYIWFNEVNFDQIFSKDDEVKNFLATPQGRHAIAFGVTSQLPEKQVVNTNKNIGLKVGLVYDQKNETHPLVKAVKRFSECQEWCDNVKRMGMLAVR